MDDKPTEPTPRADLDVGLAGVIQGYRITQKIVNWMLALVALVAVVSLAVSLFVSQNQANTAQRTVTSVVSAQCAFYRDLGVLPPPAKATEFGIKILVDSRNAYVGLNCTEKLPAPSPALIREAAKYGLVLKG